MKQQSALVLFLLVVTLSGLASPLMATSIACQEDGDADLCELDCTACLCCSPTPQTTLNEFGPSFEGAMDGRLLPEEAAKPCEPLVRDVLHVPRPVPFRKH